MKPDYLGHRKRIRQKYLEGGLAGWHDYEILELCLSYTFSRKDTKPLAKTLIHKFGSLENVLSASPLELLETEGLGKVSCAHLKLFRDVSMFLAERRLKESDAILSPGACAEYLKARLKISKEEIFLAIFLSTSNKVIKSETISEGTIDRAVIFPRKLAERALVHKAASVIVAHNHPGGSVKFSSEDIAVTKKLREALNTVEVLLLDHILIAGDDCLSMKESGLI